MSRAFLVVGALVTALAAIPVPSGAQALPATRACVDCHLELADSALAAPARDYPDDVHARSGFGCLVCHGGPRTGHGPLDPSTGFLAAPSRTEIPELCGRCHSDASFMRDFDPDLRIDQVAEYRSSTHGRLLEEGDPDVATCVSCHPAHRIRPPSDLSSTVHPLNVAGLCASCHEDPALMEPRGLPTDPYVRYGRSVHGGLLHEDGDLSAPTCNDCHGNHGAAPPGLASVHNVCGQCHTVMDELFGESGHGPLFQAAGLPGCATCHDNHEILPAEDRDLALRTEGVCGQCHDEDDPAGRELLRMAVLLDSLQTARSHARAVLDSAEAMGMQVSDAQFRLDEVDNALTQARSAVHSFRVEPVAERVAEGMEIVTASADRGQEALDEHAYRRVGLAASSAMILLLILGLLARIRTLDRHLPVQTAQGGHRP